MRERVTISHYPDVRDRNNACNHVWFQDEPSAISALCFDTIRAGKSWDEVTRLAVDRLLPVIESIPEFRDLPFIFSHWTSIRFIGSGRIAMYKRYWRSNIGKASPTGLIHGPEVELARGTSYITYATAALVMHEVLAETIDWSGVHSDAYLFLSQDSVALDESLIREFHAKTKSGFYLDDPAEFVPFAKYVTGKGGIFLRRRGAFDDPELSIQLYYRPDLVHLSSV